MIAVFVVALGVAGLILRTSLFYRRELEADASARHLPLDGIRGFLALGVFVHHLAITRDFAQTGLWRAPKIELFSALGPAPVQMFFMITGFLFWGRAIQFQGRIPVAPLAVSRLCRIAPLYLLAMGSAFVFALQRTGWRFEGEPFELWDALLRYLTCGALRIDMFSGQELIPITAGVTWTLVYEWAFYGALPLLAPFATKGRWPLLLIGLGLGIALLGEVWGLNLLGFVFGMATAHWVASEKLGEWVRSKQASWILVLLLTAGVLRRGKDLYLAEAIFLFPALALIAAGNDAFGLLRTKAARLLGASSYSIYLLHGPLLYGTLQLGLGAERVEGLSEPLYWLLGLGLTITLVLLSAITYRWIEHPAIEAGKRWTRAYRDRQRQLSPQ